MTGRADPTGRAIRASGPGPGDETLRTAYLDLLKLSLTDLANGRSQSVYPWFDGFVSRESTGEELQARVNGVVWPLHGVTMVGLKRLDDLQACVESVVADGVGGDLIEAGVWRGGASLLMRATLNSLGADDRTVYLADSFAGLPRPDRTGFPEDEELDLSGHSFLDASLSEVQGHFDRLGCSQGVEFVRGFFDETLPRLRANKWALIRLDGDTYESTWAALENLYDGLAKGGHLIVDDYGLLEPCRRAVDEFREQRSMSEELELVDYTCVRWRRESEPDEPRSAGHQPRRAARASGASRSATREGSGRILTHHELELTAEVKRLRERLRAAEREIERLG